MGKSMWMRQRSKCPDCGSVAIRSVGHLQKPRPDGLYTCRCPGCMALRKREKREGRGRHRDIPGQRLFYWQSE